MADPELTAERLNELERLRPASKLPWSLAEDGAILDADGDEVTALCNRAGDPDCPQSDAEAIVALVNAAPALLAAARERDTLRKQTCIGLTVGGGLMVYGSQEAISRCQHWVLLDSSHPQEREDVRRMLMRDLQKAEAERGAVRRLLADEAIEVGRLTACVSALEGERDEARREVEEQARLNGMGSEREARFMARVSALEEALREAEWNCAPGSGFCPLCHEPEDPMTYGNGKKVPGGHTRDCKLRALLTPTPKEPPRG